MTIASPKGGQPPLDPKSDTAEGQTETTERFKKDVAAQAALANTVKLADVHAADYDAVFYPGGHGPLWDLAEDAVQLTKIVPFLVEDELKRLGGLYERGADWQSFAIVDGRLITGQNPASSTAAALELVKLLT